MKGVKDRTQHIGPNVCKQRLQNADTKQVPFIFTVRFCRVSISTLTLFVLDENHPRRHKR